MLSGVFKGILNLDPVQHGCEWNFRNDPCVNVTGQTYNNHPLRTLHFNHNLR